MTTSLQEAEQETLAAVESMEAVIDRDAKFCGVWATVRPGLEILKTMIPGAGPLLIGSLIVIGDGVAKKVGCSAS